MTEPTVNPETAAHSSGRIVNMLQLRHWTGRSRRVVSLMLLIVTVFFGWRAWDAYDSEFRGETFAQTLEPGGPHNGFDISNASIPESDILRGGPPRDGIPAILNPKFLPVDEVKYLRDDDEVLGFVHEGEARAYPLRILVWHEIANDTVVGVPIAVTYCPLCGTCMVFDRRIGRETLTFGVSGLLYQSDVLMYDHQSESLWSQLKTEAVSGKHVGKRLEWLDSKQMTWAAWKATYPESVVLSPDTGHSRAYGRDAYASYKQSSGVMFPVPRTRTELKDKAWVVGVIVDGQAKAYPIDVLESASTPFNDRVGDTDVIVEFDATARYATVTAKNGGSIPVVQVYWFAWQAFYPDTLLYESGEGR